jgi:hypothetical protein
MSDKFEQRHNIKIFYSDFLAKSDLICFYTGLKLIYNKTAAKNDDQNYLKNPLRATVEHLEPLKRSEHDKNSVETNLVVASNGINGLLGCAPLKVKLALRDDLKNLKVDETMSIEDQYHIYAEQTIKFLALYQLDGYYCWDWISMEESELKDKLKLRFDELIIE